MYQNFDKIKKIAPSFKNIFEIFEVIINTDSTTFELINSCVEIITKQHLAGIENKKIQAFLALPASTATRSRIIRRCFLDEVISRAIEQVLDYEGGKNSFVVSIQKTILEKSGFCFANSSDDEIRTLGTEIRKLIPQLFVSPHGPGPYEEDEIYFGVYYNYSHV